MSNPGWQQQPHYPQHQHPQQQYQGWAPQQPPPYPPPGPGYPPRPPKPKSQALKILLIVGMSLAILVVCGLLALRIIYVSTDAGVEPTSEQPAPQCAVGKEALDTAHVSVYTDGHRYETSFLCKYATQRGSDGGISTDAVVEVRPVKRDTPNPETAFDDFARPPSAGQPRVEDDPRLRFGTQRKLYVTEYGSTTMLMLYVRNGSALYRVEYASSTKGFFSDSATPVDRMKPGLEAVARDLDRRTRSGLPTR